MVVSGPESTDTPGEGSAMRHPYAACFRHLRNRQRGDAVRRTLVLTATLAVVVTACTGGGSNASDRRADIYSAAIRTFLADTPRLKISSDTSVFVAAAHERSPIPLEEQADIVDELHALAAIRFVDRRVEAIDESNPNRPVKNNGVLITLGKIPSGANTVTVNASRYLNATNTIAYRVTLRRTKTQWKPIAVTRFPCRDLRTVVC
jgi:hypothetical protein